MRWIIILLLSATAFPATQAWVRASSPPAIQITGATNATPIVLTVTDTTGYAINNVISAAGVCASDGVNNISNAKGLLKIKALTPTTITLEDMNDVDVPGNGAWCSGTANGWPAGPQFLAKMTQMNLVDSPRTQFDGTAGSLTRKWALGTHNGLNTSTGIVCVSPVCTVTVDYDITCVGSGVGICAGDKFTLWSTTSTTLTASPNPFLGTEYTVLASPAPTSSTFAFTSSVTGNFTHNDACGPGVTPNGTIQGTDNCVRISFMINSLNWQWTAAMNRNDDYATGAYRWKFQGGGGTHYDVDPVGPAFIYALAFMADQTQQGYVTGGLNTLDNIELADGGNFIAFDIAADGGNYALSAEVNGYQANIGFVYDIFKGFETPTGQQTFLDKMINDIADPVACTKNLPAVVSQQSGTAQAGSSTTITLAAGASGTDHIYDNLVVRAVLAGGAVTYGIIGTSPGYVGSTKVATVASWSNGSPTTGSTYQVTESSSVASTVAGATTTMTGYHTTWNTNGAADQVHVGDYMMSFIGELTFGSSSLGDIGSYVTAVTDDTHLTVINGKGIFSAATPGTTRISPHWVSGNCGAQWLQNMWTGKEGSQPIQYPQRGGSASANADGTPSLGSNITGDLAGAMIAFYMSCAGDDARCLTNLAKESINAVDYNLSLDMGYYTGFTYSGVSYGPGRASGGAFSIAQFLRNTVVGYPSLDLTGSWVTTFPLWKQYSLRPDRPWFATGIFAPNHEYIMAYYGQGFSLSQFGPGQSHSSDMATDFSCYFAPTSQQCKYSNYFLRNVMGYTTSGSVASGNLTGMALISDPRLIAAASDYKVQPLQYCFGCTGTSGSSSRTTATVLSGWAKPATWRGDALISRSGWSSASDTHIQYQFRTFVGDHDCPQSGDLQVYKVGALLMNDELPPGDCTMAGTGSFVALNNVVAYKAGIGDGGPGIAYIDRYSGTLPYGDPSSKYACIRANIAGAYTTALTRAFVYGCHFKNSGDDELFITYKDILSPSAIIINDQILYPQNLETPVGGNAEIIYPEGDTSCPGSGGCASLNTNRVVLEQEDGLSSNGDPTRQYNLISNFLSPGTVTLSWIGASPTGHAYLAKIYGGSSVGGTSTSLQLMSVHKIATQPDTTLVSSLLSGGAGWVVAQASNCVMALSSDGTDHSSAAFTTTYSGTGQVVVMGLIPGAYAIKIAGTPIAGSPLSVPANDNSLHFFGAAGAVTVDLQGVATGGTPVYGSTIVRGK